ncbi:MAG: 50S ribosomal protein L20 [Nitrospirota bacterium]
MPRAKGGFKTKRYHKKVVARAKGYYGARSRLYKVAAQAVDKALVAAYKDRKFKKREYRALWIARINAAVRSLDMTYSQFMNGLKKANISMNRKALADLAYHDFKSFSELVKQVAQHK